MGSMIYSDENGVKRTLLWDTEHPNEFHVKTTMDMEPIIDGNRMLAEMHPTTGTNKLVARVPLTIAEQAIHEDWDEDRWKQWLNDPDNKLFRVWPGRV